MRITEDGGIRNVAVVHDKAQLCVRGEGLTAPPENPGLPLVVMLKAGKIRTRIPKVGVT